MSNGLLAAYCSWIFCQYWSYGRKLILAVNLPAISVLNWATRFLKLSSMVGPLVQASTSRSVRPRISVLLGAGASAAGWSLPEHPARVRAEAPSSPPSRVRRLTGR